MRTMEQTRPITRTELKEFIGFTGYFSQFIQDYTKLMLPLYKCLKGKRNKKFNWTNEAGVELYRDKRENNRINI